MKSIRILFYKPKIDGHIVDNLIAGWTKLWNLSAPKQLTCSHVEIWTPDEEGKFVEAKWITYPEGKLDKQYYAGNMYSSTMGQVGGKNRKGSGVRKATASEILKHPERWFYMELEITDGAYEKLIEDMEYDVAHNQGYDKKMIWSFFGWRSANDKDKYICSEFCFKYVISLAKYVNFREDRITLLDFLEWELKTTMSPIRGAYTLWQCGLPAYNLDGTLLLEAEQNCTKGKK